MTPKKLRFRARGDALVQNFARLEAGIKSFVGRKYVCVNGDPSKEDAQWGFKPTGEDEEVAYAAEYVRACKEEALWAADEATAKACGVKFDSNFGESPKAKEKG